MNNFDKEIRDKLFHYAIPEEKGNWDALAMRMAKRAAFKRRTRWAWTASAVAAAVLLFLFLVVPFTGRLTAPVFQTCTIIPAPAGVATWFSTDPIEEILTHARMDVLRNASKVPVVSEMTSDILLPPLSKPILATADQLAAEPAYTEPAHTPDPVQDALIRTKDATKRQDASYYPLFPIEPPKPSRINKKWITAANFSYQGAINGTYLFTPSTYTTKWETPLSLAASDLSNLGIPDYMAPDFGEDDMNRISAHFSTPMSAGLNVQKEINKWLSVGFSLTYTLLRGEYQVHTADKSYIVNQNTHYIGIPVGIYLRAVNTRSLTVYAVGGGAVDRAVADEYVCQLNDVATRQFNPVQGVQWSLYGGLGIEYKWSELMGIYIEPSVSHYFDNNQPKSIRTIQPTQFKMEIGIRFRI